MKIHLFLILFCLCSCSQQDNFAEVFAKCKANKKSATPNDLHAELMAEFATYKCIRGANGPDITATSIDNTIINTLATDDQAVVLYYWSIPLPNTPSNYAKYDYENILALNILSEKYKGRVRFIGFSPNDTKSVKQFITEYPFNFPQVANADSLWAPLFSEPVGGPPIGGPIILFINTNGKVTYAFSGSYTNASKTIQRYKPVLEACLTNSVYID
ncbi:peroxiredoxin family protein [Hymenobacter psychrotolerans]|nr:peroxiredoxin family protein [Hymenobacter psychrotolerans]